MSAKPQLLQKIESRSARVGVIGLGYVGLPLAVEFANAGFTTLGYDVSADVAKRINEGHSHIADVPSDAVASLVKAGKLSATSDAKRLGELDAISIAVPTPLEKNHDPDMRYVLRAIEAVAAVARPGQLVVLESTTYPGTTRELAQPALEKRGLVIGRDVFLAFSPERVDPGNAVWAIRDTPKVVGGLTDACTAVAVALYSTCIKTVVPVSSPEVAELTKLLENTFRSVNIALVNELVVICEKLGIDVWEVIEAAATKPFGFYRFNPGPGVGGHCIPLDPHYLAWKMRKLDFETRFITLASEINEGMPRYVVDKVVAGLNQDRKAVNGSRVLVLGVAYKRNIEDMRESPALDVIRLLEELGADVVYHDPYVPQFDEHGMRRQSVPLSDDELRRSDAVVIVTDHSDIDYQRIVNRATLIVDTRNATARATPGRARIVSLSSATPSGGGPKPVAKVVA